MSAAVSLRYYASPKLRVIAIPSPAMRAWHRALIAANPSVRLAPALPEAPPERRNRKTAARKRAVKACSDPQHAGATENNCGSRDCPNYVCNPTDWGNTLDDKAHRRAVQRGNGWRGAFEQDPEVSRTIGEAYGTGEQWGVAIRNRPKKKKRTSRAVGKKAPVRVSRSLNEWEKICALLATQHFEAPKNRREQVTSQFWIEIHTPPETENPEADMYALAWGRALKATR